MNGIIGTFLKSKHTTSAGLAYFVLKALPSIAHIWFPSHEQEIASTVNLLEPIAITYGLAMAGDAKQAPSKQEMSDLQAQVEATQKAVVSGDTSHITKADLPPPVTPDTIPKP